MNQFTPLPKREAATFLKQLKALQKDLEFDSAASFAEFLGVKSGTLRSWYRGENRPTYEAHEVIFHTLESERESMDDAIVAIDAFLGHEIRNDWWAK